MVVPTPAKQRQILRYGIRRHGLAAVAAAVGVAPHTLALYVAGRPAASDVTRRALERATVELDYGREEICRRGLRLATADLTLIRGGADAP